MCAFCSSSACCCYAILPPAVGYALLPAVDYAVLPAVGYALVPAFGYARLPAVGYALLFTTGSFRCGSFSVSSSATLWWFTAPWWPLAPPTPLRGTAPVRDRWFAVGAVAPRSASLQELGLLSLRTAFFFWPLALCHGVVRWGLQHHCVVL